MSEILEIQNSVLITGDFNIHVNKREDTDKNIFDELMECLNLQQHVVCQTHKSGNTLDLLITKCTDTLLLSEPVESFYISDHCFVHTYLSRPKPRCTREVRKFRKISKIDTAAFMVDLENVVSGSSDIMMLNDLAGKNCYH